MDSARIFEDIRMREPHALRLACGSQRALGRIRPRRESPFASAGAGAGPGKPRRKMATNPNHHSSNPVSDELCSREVRERLVHVALGILREGAEAEDAAHDAVEQALRGSNSFRAEARVSTWLHRVVVNAALMRARRRRHMSEYITTNDQKNEPERHASEAVVQATPTPMSLLESMEERWRLRRAVAALPRPYRELVNLCVFEELALPEAARSLGISSQAARTRMCRARAQLRETLAA